MFLSEGLLLIDDIIKFDCSSETYKNIYHISTMIHEMEQSLIITWSVTKHQDDEYTFF